MSTTSDFFADPLGFAQIYSICPVNNIAGYKGKLATDLDTSGYSGVGPDPAVPITSIKYSRVMQSKKVGYVELFKDERAQLTDGNLEGVDVTRMRAGFAPFGEAEPVYFLPWDEAGAIVKLHIPPKGTHNPDPDIFFTAAINGCSVFVQGTPDDPTVYHAGGSTNRSDKNDAARFWRVALRNHIRNSATAQARGQISGEINKTHYVTTPGTSNDSSTPTAEKYEKLLKDKLNKQGSFEVREVSPWGCVFGIRTGDDWAFYLQENATVICNYVRPAGVRTVCYARPMKINQIFPGGSSQISAMNHIVPISVT
ncbi:hypothetical protein DKT77_12845 [Meridianimarinicoccus roseus]|uniref:Uncharacterized protein n=1 Tax=Meridianimarinicoccus roseus TaxID=2072018 RepID=A0A2V2LJZ4_9RHOB|nr:hypothetical protein [Meridianimarinicoccus roseus]PWR02153.1 hypothetical protein DKT77_12845 [Meridianimarinicoccus roseus]